MPSEPLNLFNCSKTNEFLSINHDGTVTRDHADGTKTVLDIDPAVILGEGVANFLKVRADREKGRPFVPVRYCQPISTEPEIWYEIGLKQAKEQADAGDNG